MPKWVEPPDLIKRGCIVARAYMCTRFWFSGFKAIFR
jgi:hypothetical protein